MYSRTVTAAAVDEAVGKVRTKRRQRLQVDYRD